MPSIRAALMRNLFRLLVALLPSLAAGAERVFQAGAAQLDVTPELGALIVGGFSPIPARHIHDPLRARALVLDDGAHRIALAVVDNVAIGRECIDAAKRLIEERSRLPGAQVMVSATHTHSGPNARGEEFLPSGEAPRETPPATPPGLTPYQRFLARRIADVVQCAIQQLEPAKIGWGSVRQPQHVFNRRWFVQDERLRRNPFGGIDRVRMNPPRGAESLERPAGPTDPEIPFLAVRAADGRPLGLLAAYALHYVGGVGAADISADYFGVFDDRMRQLVGAEGQTPAFVALMANGTSGDVNHIDFREPAAPGRRPYEQIRRVAHAVAEAVFAAYRQIEYREWAPVASRYRELNLALRRPPPELVARSRELLAQPPRSPPWHPQERVYANRVLQLAAGPERTDVPLQAFRIGELAIVAMPTETFAETGLELKARAPFERTMPIGLANGALGYLPTPEQHELGGYESWFGTNRLEVQASVKMVDALLAMVAEMKP